MEGKTIEQLQEELALAVADNAKLQDVLVISQKEAADNLELANVVEAKRAELEVEVADLKKQLDASHNDTRIQVEARQKENELIGQLQSELDGYKKLSDEGKSINEFEYGCKRYLLKTGKARIKGLNDGQPLTALEILNSAEAQAALVACGSGLIQELA